MRVCVTTEQRFARTPDGVVWAATASPYSFWARYLRVFDAVRVIARIADVDAPAREWRRADGEGVSFAPVPYWVGPLAYLRHHHKVRSMLRRALDQRDAVVMRVASTLAASAEAALHGGRPFGLEVVGDPYDVFAPGSVNHPLRPVWRWWFTTQLKRQCRSACAVAYVTREALQRRYSASRQAYSTSYSSIELGADAFAERPRLFASSLTRPRIVSIGSFDQKYKGFDELIEAVAECIPKGIEAEVVMVGEGRYRPELQQHVARLGLNSRVTFTGQLPPGEAVREQLDRADLFVLASKTEGLPRAMIEAMGRGVPCIGTAVGGIPELLNEQDLVPPGDPKALARAIAEVVTDPARMTRMSVAGMERAREYRDSALDSKRRAFLTFVRQATEQWVDRLGRIKCESCT